MSGIFHHSRRHNRTQWKLKGRPAAAPFVQELRSLGVILDQSAEKSILCCQDFFALSHNAFPLLFSLFQDASFVLTSLALSRWVPAPVFSRRGRVTRVARHLDLRIESVGRKIRAIDIRQDQLPSNRMARCNHSRFRHSSNANPMSACRASR